MKLDLYPFQSTAVQNTVKEFATADRTKVIMPCGTGKSLVGVHIMNQMAPRRSLVVSPSLALVKQLLDTHTEQGSLSRILVVCSDDSTAKEARDKFEIPGVTTDAKLITSELRKKTDVMVFSTYQSSPKIAEAFAGGSVPAFDLAVFDEAHHMAGGSKIFTTALDDDRIKIRKRLFMTATPRVATKSAKQQAEDEGYEFYSMDDEEHFGREAFGMSFNEAIEGDYLTDYQVAIFVVKESEIQEWVDKDEDYHLTAKRVALIRAMQEHDIRKVIAYHKTINQMKWFADVGLQNTFNAFKESNAVSGTLWSGALEGSDSAGVRRQVLNHFAGLNGDTRAVLNNCRVLQEGVDCPSVDAVCLIDSRTSPIDIVQIVGRAIRRSPNKQIATIILPVFMPSGVEDDVESFIQSSDFAVVWDVVAAIKAHDSRVQGWVSSAGSFGSGESKSHIKFNINLPSRIQGKFFDAIESRIVRRFRANKMLTEDLIWGWMKLYFITNGKYPSVKTNESPETGEEWRNIDSSLRIGNRGLRGGSSIAMLKSQRTGVKSVRRTSMLKESIVFRWMKRYCKEKGHWPRQSSMELSPEGSTWCSVNSALQVGVRGLAGGSSLKKLRLKFNGLDKPQLTEDNIFEWMKEYFEENQKWPLADSKETIHGRSWRYINKCLKEGKQGLTGGSSFIKLILKHGRDPNLYSGAGHGIVRAISDEKKNEIFDEMSQYLAKNGRWPNAKTSSEWHRLDAVLSKRGSSLSKLRKQILGE